MFKEIAITASEKYYDYLKKENKGMDSCAVNNIKRKEESIFVLTLGKPLKLVEGVQIGINNLIYDVSDIKPLRYDKKHRELEILVKSNCIDVIKNCKPQDVLVVSDLTFLVKRVEEWYKKYGKKLHMPSALPEVEPPDFTRLSQEPSADQKNAIDTVFSYPFTYIWGAPGTGKTKFVLANCLIPYVKAEKKILITAPTNNALEQTLYGLLPVLEANGVDIEKTVLRLGLPSSAFVEQYSEVCEDTGVVKQINDLNDFIKTTKAELNDCNKKLQLYYEYEKTGFLKVEKEEKEKNFDVLFSKIDELNVQKKQNELTVLEASIISLQEELKQKNVEENNLIKQIGECKSKVEKYSSGITKVIMQNKLSKSQENLKDLLSRHNALKLDIQQIEENITSQKEQASLIKLALCDLQEKLEKYWEELKDIADDWQKLKQQIERIDKLDFKYARNVVDLCIRKLTIEIDEKIRQFDLLEDFSEEGALREKEKLENELQKYQEEKSIIEESSQKGSISNRSIIAATMDTLLNRILPDGDFRPSHIFLDEAGYCSLIKGATLTAFDCPITFLGDHMQLPPVCEMNELQIKSGNEEVCLWSLSSLFTEQFLTESFDEVFKSYYNHKTAEFHSIKKSDLIQTYRFGPALANVLAEEVYSEQFTGNESYETEMFYIDARKIPETKPHSSISECDAILKYLKENQEDDVGIITPYVNQRQELKNRFKGNKAMQDSIMTVHGSQGREWDTVIFSVADTTDMWFTNSLHPKSDGKKVINTAVSRAKKKLIIVCDAEYWKPMEKQLIGKILSVAEEIIL